MRSGMPPWVLVGTEAAAIPEAVAGIPEEAAAFPVAADRRAAVAPRGAGDEHFQRGSRSHHGIDPRGRGKDRRRDCLRAGGDFHPYDGIAGFYRCRSCSDFALAAHGIYRDDGFPDFVAAGCGVSCPVNAAFCPSRTGSAVAVPCLPRNLLLN